MADDGLWRIIATRNLAVNSSGGAVASTVSVSAQTYALELAFPAAAQSTAGCRFLISDMAATSITSTTGAYLPPNTLMRYRCTPGQKIQAISADGSAIPSLVIVELSK
jgi:hypothetical protein